MEKLLHLFKYVDGVNDTPFPSKEQQGILYDFKYDAERMGNVPTITGTLMHPLCLDEEWGDGRVYVLFNNEKYFLKQTPTSSYSNEDTRYKHELDLVSERTILNDVYFYDVVASDVSNDKPVSNSSNFSFYGDIHEFAQRLNYSLQYANVGYSVVVDEGITSDAKGIAFQDQYIMDVLQEIYKTYEIPFYFVGKVIHIGYTNSSIETPFKYGVRDALLSISKNNITQKIVNRITGIGSSDNIPYYYPNFDPKGETEILLKGEPTDVVTIENLNAYKKVKLSDKFIYSSESSYRLDYIDKSKYSVTKEPYLVSEPNASTRIWEVILDFPFSVDIYQDSYIEIGYSKGDDGFTNYQARLYRNSELRDRFDAFGTIPYYRLIEGNYNFSFTLRYEFKEGSEKQDLTMEDIPNIVNNALELSIYANVEGYKQWTLNKASNVVELSKFGLKYNGTPHNGDIITFKQLSYITPQPNLMPPIYRGTKANERFYNALNNTYLNPSTNNYYHFESPFVVGKPKEQIVSFEDIKPSIVGITNASGMRIDMFSEFAYDTNDNDEFDEEGNYLHPYFFAKLRKFDGDFGFNLFEHSIEEDEMVISMTSGSCGSCNFVIGVDKETQKNIVQVDENGDLLRDSNGNVLYGSPQEKQNDTINNEVWIALKKDIETFGVIMPNANNNYRPNVSDTFVILHIDLPKVYIFAAENQLKEALIDYMFENNSEKFNFSINFSRIYFAENPNILAQLNENSHIRLEYNNIVYSLYVSSFAYNMSNDNPLPEIKIELSKDLTIKKESILTQLSNASKQLVVTIKRVDSSINATNKDVAKTTSTTMTSISETNARVDNVEKVLRDIQDGNGTSSGGGNGSINYDDLEDYLTQEEYAKKEDIPSLDGYVTNDDLNNKGFATEQWVNNKGYLTNLALNGYATENWVRNQGYLTQHQDLSAYAKSEDIAKTYATKVELSTTNTNLSNLLASHNTLRSDFDNLNNLLNSDVNSTIDTWNEVVAFLDGYSESDDLATILSQMNTDITNKVGYDEFEKVSDATKDLLSYFDVNGYALNAINSLKLGGIDAGNYWHKGNSGTLDYNWKAKKLNVRTLVIPTSEPTDLSKGEVGFYLGTAGQGAEEPNGSGGLDLTELWAELGSEDYAKKIHISHIPTIQYSSIAGRPSALVNPYALTINGVVYDGSEPISLDISAGGGVADAVAWGNVFNKPSTISGYGITDAYTKDSVDLKLSNYLPKSGGILDSGSDQVPLILNSVGETTRLAYRKNGTTLGYLGFSGVDNPVFINSAGGSRTLLHQDNYHYYALSVTGGKISGSITFTRDGVDKAFFSYGDSNGGYISVGGSFLGVLSDGTPHYNRNILIHSGNYSNYALPLTGGTLSSANVPLIVNRKNGGLSLISYHCDNVHVGNLGFDTSGNLLVRPNLQTNSTYYNVIHSGNIGSQRVSYASSAGNADTLDNLHASNFYQRVLNTGELIDANAIARDRVIHSYKWTNAPTDNIASLIDYSYSDDWRWQLFASSLTQKLYSRCKYDGTTWTDWREFAFTDSDITGNAASATKLKTARTIWGQSFDGTGDVSGDMSNVGVINSFIKPTKESSSIAYLHITNFSSSAYDGVHMYIANKDNSNNLRPLVLQNGFGNVLIGTQTDNGYKLQVNGTLKANGLIIPTSAPTDLKAGDHALYLGSVGEGAELPSGTGGLDVAELWAELGKVDESKQINVSHIPTIEIARVSGLQTALNNKADASALSSYLLKSGGTISSSSVVPLTVNSTGDNTRIAFKQNGDTLGYFAFAKANTPLFIDNEGGRYTMFHSGNFNPNDYLAKSGGTITNDLQVNGYLSTQMNRLRLGAYYLIAGTTWKVTDASWQNEYTLYHTGNLTKLSQLADDIVSGKYQPLITSNNKLAYSLISGTPVLASVATSGKYSDLSGVPTSLPASDVYAWAKKSSLAVSDVPNLDWSKITSGKPTTLTGYGITDALSTSGGVVGDLAINATSDAFLQILLNGTSKALVGWQSNHGVRLYNYASASYLSIKDDGTPTYNGNTLIHSGNIGSYNAGSATKLQTARTIWGQSFDGSGNVSGSLAGVANISMSGLISGFSYLYNNSTNGFLLGSRDVLGGSAGGAVVYTYGDTPIDFYTGYALRVHIHYNGNVLIGTTTDNGSKLQVNGAMEATELVIPTAPPTNPQAGKHYLYLA